jgi:protein-arginine kinase activator protein McsA
MGKYNQLKFLKRTEARVNHICSKCGKEIESGSFYYAEKLRDRFLHIPYAKKFCAECYENFGDRLIAKRVTWL